jgi:hypothetical protein
MTALRHGALGGAAMVLLDRVFDVQSLTWPALLVGIICIAMESRKYGRRLYP